MMFRASLKKEVMAEVVPSVGRAAAGDHAVHTRQSSCRVLQGRPYHPVGVVLRVDHVLHGAKKLVGCNRVMTVRCRRVHPRLTIMPADVEDSDTLPAPEAGKDHRQGFGWRSSTGDVQAKKSRGVVQPCAACVARWCGRIRVGGAASCSSDAWVVERTCGLDQPLGALLARARPAASPPSSA